MVKKKKNPTKQEFLRAAAKAVSNAGYSKVAQQIREDKNVEENVKWFLKQYKKKMYGKFYPIKADGSIGKGRTDPKKKALYDRVEKSMNNFLRVYKREYK